MVLLLSWDTALRFRDRVTVAPLTTRVRGLDAEVFLDHNDGLQHGCVVNLDVIATVLRSDLDRRVTRVSQAKMDQVERAIHLALGISLPCTIG
jgi:mRNA interferase MazF